MTDFRKGAASNAVFLKEEVIGRKNHMEVRKMSVISMKQLLEAGVHFGHQTRRWNPKMAASTSTQREMVSISLTFRNL